MILTKKLRREDFYYADKTGFIAELLENGGKLNLFTRPRRFGVENIRVYGIAFCEKRRRVVTALMEPQSGEKDPGGRKSFRVFEWIRVSRPACPWDPTGRG